MRSRLAVCPVTVLITRPDSSKNFRKNSKNILTALSKEKTQLDLPALSVIFHASRTIAAYPYYDEPLTPSGGVTSQLPVLLAEYTFRNTRDIKDYLGLLSQMDTYFLGILDYEQKKADAGLFMSDEACLKVIEGCEVFTEHPDDNFLIDTFSNRLNAMDGLTVPKRMLI